MAARTRNKIDPNQKLVGQGLANIAGARTGMSSVFTGLFAPHLDKGNLVGARLALGLRVGPAREIETFAGSVFGVLGVPERLREFAAAMGQVRLLALHWRP